MPPKGKKSQVERLPVVHITPRMQSVARMGEGTHEFEVLGYGEWNVPNRQDPSKTDNVPYIRLATDQGPKGLSLGSFYYATLTSEDESIAVLLEDYNNDIAPVVGLKGTLVINKNGDNFEYSIDDVALDQLVVVE